MLGLILIIIAALLVILDMAATPPRFPYLTQIAVLLVCIALLVGYHQLPLH